MELFLAKLGEELGGKRYRAQGVRRAWIPKVDGSRRALGIPTMIATCTLLYLVFNRPFMRAVIPPRAARKPLHIDASAFVTYY